MIENNANQVTRRQRSFFDNRQRAFFATNAFQNQLDLLLARKSSSGWSRMKERSKSNSNHRGSRHSWSNCISCYKKAKWRQSCQRCNFSQTCMGEDSIEQRWRTFFIKWVIHGILLRKKGKWVIDSTVL